MEKIFFIDNPTQISSLDAIEHILAKHFQITNPQIARNENGKPYLESPQIPIFFSVTHTKKQLFIVFSDENVGADAELWDREVRYESILHRFSLEEREQINSSQSFLSMWTIKESAIKWLGGTIAHDLEKLSYRNGSIFYKQLPLPVKISTRLFEGHILSICSEKDFSDAPFIHYTIQTK